MTPFGRPTGNQPAFQPMLTPAYAAPALIRVEANKSPLQTIGLNLLAIYLFAIFSLLTEVSTEVFGFKPYVTLVTGPLAIILSILSGHALRMLKTKIGVFTLLFLLWLLVASPFTSWRSGTLETLTDVFLRSYSIVFMTAALAITLKDCLRIMYVLAAGGISLFFVSWFYGIVGSDGRFVISFGALMNPNDLATHLMVVLPFCLIVAATTKHSFTIRPVSILLGFGMLLITLKTASRAALISIVVMSLIMLVKATSGQKLLALGGTFVLALVSVVVLPSQVWHRFATTYSDTEEDSASYGVSSREGRKVMLKRSIDVTLSHPIAGIGPGAFIAYDADEAKRADRRAKWLGTHNSYTEVSSEAGIPALIFFAGALIAAILACAQIYKKASKRADLKELSSCALFLLIALAGLCVNIFFSSIAYRYFVPVLLGLTISFSLAAKERLEALALTPPSLPPENTMMPRAGRPSVQFQPVSGRTQPTMRFSGVRRSGSF